ncbi:MAG TPA: ABC transporter substrate-binding protein [Chloroflexota bacterium]|nr:ABC transporter substrate-binding protein [Chloroflexota bacterium]
MQRLSGWCGIVLSGVVLGLVACAPAAAPRAAGADSAAPAAAPARAAGTFPAPLQRVVDAARAERELVLLWSGVDQPEEIRRLADGFNHAYGLDVRVQFTPGPSMPAVGAKIAQEYQAGRPASSDVFIGSESHLTAMLEADALEPIDWASWSLNVRDPRLLAPNGVAVKLASRAPGITYNTQRVSEAALPRTLDDLLRPEFKGRIASTPYAATFNRLASPEVWGEQRTLEYTRRLAEQVAGLMRCSELERVASGEFDLFALDCGAEWRKFRRDGAPIGHVIPADAAVLVYWHVAVPRNAAHPNAARLWVDYLLSREAQDVLFEYELTDNHLVPGSHAAPEIEALQAQGVQFADVDVAFAQRTDEKWLAAITRQLQDILTK